MVIASGDLKLYLTGGAANSNPSLSLGGTSSSVLFTDNTINNLFGNVNPAEAAAGSVKYRALSFKNTSAQTAYSAVMYISQETLSGYTTVAIALDSGTQSVANEDTAPSSPALSFSTPVSLATGIALGDISAGGSVRVWFRRTVTAAASYYANDTGKITFTVGSA